MPSTIWKGSISFGLVSFPVRLHSAARAETVRFHLLHAKDKSRVKQVWLCAKDNERVERSEMVKGYETGDDEYVVVEEAELKKIAPPTASTMEILQFVANDEVNPIYFESSYYVVPEGKTAKPYTLFVAALKDTGQDAVAQVAMHNREHVVLIRPSEDGLLLHTLYYSDELHEDNKAEVPKANYTAKELALAKSLISQLKAPFKPEDFTDTYRENVERLIQQKQRGQKVTSIRPPRKAPVVDLMEALRRSLKSSQSEKPDPKAANDSATRKKAGRHRAA